MLKTSIIALSACLFVLPVLAQKNPSTAVKVPLQAANWEYKPNTVEFITHQSVPAMKIVNSGDAAILKGFDFTDGTIEYDIDPVDPRFTAFYFRQASLKERECFYFRSARAGQQDAVDAVQYAPFIDGINLWDMMWQYQAYAPFERGRWIHVKLVVAGRQMRVYINDNNWPVLVVPRLEGNTSHGTLAFDGQTIIANLVVRHGQTEGLSPVAGADVTDNDARYIRCWKIGQPVDMPEKVEFTYELLPAKEAVWDTIRAERQGLINITRRQGGTPVGKRRLIWLKTNIASATAQTKKLAFGFSDDVWVFLNGQLLYVDKNSYGQPIVKQPDGRISIDNASFALPLRQGDNELLIAVANNFYGWGIMARLENKGGITLDK